MFYKTPRQIEVKCTNPDCELYTKGTTIGVNRIESEDLNKILRCPQCGKEIRVIKVKKSKTI